MYVCRFFIRLFSHQPGKKTFRLFGFVLLFVLAHQVFIRKLLVYHFVNGSPVRQSAQVAVVDEEVCFQFARVVIVLPFFFFGVIAVDGIKIQSAFMAELYSLVQQAAFAYTP